MIEKAITVFGFLFILNGLYTSYLSIKPESRTYIVAPDEKPFEGGTVSAAIARKGMRFMVYGFLLHLLKLIV